MHASPLRIVVIYDRTIRPDTTGVYCEAALRRLGHEVAHHAPLEHVGGSRRFRGYDDLPAEADLYLQIDDDLGYPGPPRGGALSVYWCIDTHRMTQLVDLGRTSRWDKAAEVDLVLSAQRDRAGELGAVWLPLAFDPAVCRPLANVAKRYDWCFVGNLGDAERQRWLAVLLAAVPNAFVGSAYGEELNTVLNAARVAVNVPVGNDVNMRFFEAYGAGVPMLSRAVHNGEDTLFDSMMWVEQPHEAVRLLRLMLADPVGLDRLGRRGAERARTEHTYEARMRVLIEAAMTRRTGKAAA